MPKLIEIIGPPGSGKTFLCSELQKVKKNKKIIFFHSGQKRRRDKVLKLNFLYKILIFFKVVIKMVIFYLLFFKRIFLKKIYKRSFFLRIVLLIYKDLISIEKLKIALASDKILLMEPGIIMHFLQDYFYVNENISKTEIWIFNKLFVNANFIFHTNAKISLIKKRLNTRDRGFPQRMVSLTSKNKTKVTNKSINTIKDYISKSQNLNANIIKLDTSKNIKNLKKIILSSIY